MFSIKIAELTICIDNQYPFVESVCANFIVHSSQYDFSVSVSADELLSEHNASGPQFSIGYIESVCVYRKIAIQLPNYDAFVFHSAAINFNDSAFCFAAKSGTGKTTHINLWRKLFNENVSVINGDKPIIRLFNGIPYVCGTPWSGKERLESNTITPLKGICFLQQASNNSIIELDTFEALGKFLKQVYIPNDSQRLDTTLKTIDVVIKNIPIWELYCNTSEEAAILAHSVMLK